MSKKKKEIEMNRNPIKRHSNEIHSRVKSRCSMIHDDESSLDAVVDEERRDRGHQDEDLLDGRSTRSGVTSILTVTCAVLHVNVPCTTANQAVMLRPSSLSRFPQEGTSPDRPPLAVYFLPNLAAHRRPHRTTRTARE